MEYKQRLLLEYKELVERREVLQRTLNFDKPQHYDEETVKLLREQLEAMLKYEKILFIRIVKEM